MRGRVAFAAFVALLVVTTVAAKPPDMARIVEHVSAGGVKLGASRSAVTRAWGPANECLTIVKSWYSDPGVVQCSWGARGQRPSQLEVEFLRSKAIAIHVRLIPFVEGGFPGWQTPKGIALGATPAAVRSAYGAQLRQAAGDGDYGSHLYLSKQNGETIVETRFSLPQEYDRDQTVRQIAIYDLKARWICGTVAGPRWATRPGSSPSERGNRYRVQLTSGYRKAQLTCALARQWASRLVRQRPRRLYPTSGSSNSLAGPLKPKRYICSGQTGGRGKDQHGAYLKTGATAIVGSCYPTAARASAGRPIGRPTTTTTASDARTPRIDAHPGHRPSARCQRHIGPGSGDIRHPLQGPDTMVTVVLDPAQPVDSVEFLISGFADYDYTDYDAPFEIGLIAGPSGSFRITAILFYQGDRVGTLRSDPVRLCTGGGGGGGSGTSGSARITSKCVGTGAYAKVTVSGGATVQRVQFTNGGRDAVDRSAPYEAWFTPASLVGVPATSAVSATVYRVGAQPQRLEARGKACPRLIRKKPPLSSRIIEGISLGGVGPGMPWGEAEAQWGTPDRDRACHGGGAPIGSFVCDWDTRGGRNGPISVIFADNRQSFVVGSVLVHTEAARRPKYARWKTSAGIGVGSTSAALVRAYGGRLRTVPFGNAGRTSENERTYYLVTSRGGSKWVTAFHVPLRQVLHPWQLRRVERIDIMSSPAFRQYYDLYAPPGWRP